MAANTTLIIQTGLKELASVFLNPAVARRVRMYEPVGRGPIIASPTLEDAQWFGAVVEKNKDMPATRTVGNWRTSADGARILGSKETLAASDIVVTRRGRLGGIHMDPKTHEITLVYYDADVRLTPGKFLATPVAPRSIFH